MQVENIVVIPVRQRQRVEILPPGQHPALSIDQSRCNLGREHARLPRFHPTPRFRACPGPRGRYKVFLFWHNP